MLKQKTPTASEKKLEAKLQAAAKAAGGLALKFVSPNYAGVPDRIVLLPGGRILFAELKSSGKEPTPLQKYVHGRLERLGFRVVVISTDLELAAFVALF